jgi:hypothetical protein
MDKCKRLTQPHGASCDDGEIPSHIHSRTKVALPNSRPAVEEDSDASIARAAIAGNLVHLMPVFARDAPSVVHWLAYEKPTTRNSRALH